LETLLLMAGFDKPTTEKEVELPNITQETLSDMIGTTRSRVSFFMNRFRKLGYIDYSDGHLKVYKLLLTAMPEENNASKPRDARAA
jgi:CRP/FNR family cyclic AMP-dependent transcriptional regulator